MFHIIPVLAAGPTLPFLFEIVILLAASALIGYVCQRLKLVPIVGFLLAGVLLSPSALGLVQDQELIDAAAEIGVILLLFTIGIEFSLEQLARISRLIFFGGGMQVALVTTIVTGVLVLFGVSWQVALYTGCLLSLSSTAVVMKLLSDRNETDSAGGQNALGILVFQDLAVVAMVLLVPMLGGDGGSFLGVAQALGTAVGIIAVVLLVARRLMPPLLEAVARTCSQEIFLLTVVAVCFGTAYLTSLAGVSLSLGAFLAGLVVSESSFKEYAFGEIMPLQVLFSAVFFVSVGLLLDVGFLFQNLGLVAAVVAVVLLLKVLTTGLSVRLLGASLGTAAFSSLMLAQIGEFSLVLERTGREAGLFPMSAAEAGTQTFIAATVILIVLTPFLAQAGAWLQRRIDGGKSQGEQPDTAPQAAAARFGNLYDHVIIAGYGPSGAALARILHDAKVPYGVLTLSPDGANDAEQAGLRVLRSDYSRQITLDLAGINRAKAMVIADDTPAVTHRVVTMARSLNPSLRILASTRTGESAYTLTEAGANVAISEEQVGLAHLASQVLDDFAVNQDRIEQYVSGIYAEPSTNGAVQRRDATVELAIRPNRAERCSHLNQIQVVEPSSSACEECVRLGDTWVHLRICMTCGNVACCDSSKNKHASQHHADTEHPIIRSFQPGEDWGWCYEDKVML